MEMETDMETDMEMEMEMEMGYVVIGRQMLLSQRRCNAYLPNPLWWYCCSLVVVVIYSGSLLVRRRSTGIKARIARIARRWQKISGYSLYFPKPVGIPPLPPWSNEPKPRLDTTLMTLANGVHLFFPVVPGHLWAGASSLTWVLTNGRHAAL